MPAPRQKLADSRQHKNHLLHFDWACTKFRQLLPDWNPMYRSNSVYTAARQKEILRQVSRLTLVGIGLFGVAIFAPDSGPNHAAFYYPALHSRWFSLLEMAAAWSSIKIILFCAGLVLLIESTGTVLSVMKMKSLALFVFLMQIIPCLGLVCGGYYLAKALF